MQLLIKPTRLTVNSATLIDHIISNSTSENHDISILTSNISDHFPLMYVSSTKKSTMQNKTVTYRNFSKTQIDKFATALNSIDWQILTTFVCTQQTYDHFSETFFALYDIYFPLLTKRINKNTNPIHPWVTPGLLISRRSKTTLHTISIKEPTQYNISKYKTYRNLYNSTIRNSKRLYFQQKLLKSQSDAK